ncbi:hypothetical protein [Rhizobium sp. YS-1r]|uniref:hypothetical protein n=1 Tax=Rhizobium sp. YS-1r TaxID=1532558 RepID=UPI00050E9FF2|nr:hypothetical protein [Rhizobium sp. YS-1r]KGD87665.1 hypothetical protein JL39_25850 [Rhizobium sp. YS-1r]
MTVFADLLWPRVPRLTAAQTEARNKEDDQDVAVIRAADWSQDTDLALEEARGLAAAEKERRVGAESKASIYLAAVAAVVPIALPICTAFYGETFVKLPLPLQIVTLLLFFATTAYLIGAAWWAFRTFRVSVHHRIDAVEYARIWSGKGLGARLVAELLIVTRLNRHMVNWKTTCVRQAHEFLLRVLISFTTLVVLVVSWQPILTLWKFSKNYVARLLDAC